MDDLVHNAGIRIRELEAEIGRLKRRLEITHAYDGAGNEIPFPAGMEQLDGIACRDETIRQQDAQIEKLKEEIARVAPAPSRPADRGALQRIYDRFIVDRGDLSDSEALEAIRRVCEQAGLGGNQ